MPDVPVSALDARQQKLVENSRLALEGGNWTYVVEATGHVLRAVPGCVEARRMQHAAQLKLFEGRSRFVAKAMSGLSATPFIFSSVTRDPNKALASAEKILSGDPTSASALKLLADAAMELDMPGTAAFAREAVQRLSPADFSNLLELGEACLAAGRPDDALKAADALLQFKPLDSAGQTLMRKAAIAQATASGLSQAGSAAPAPVAAPASVPPPSAPAAVPTEEQTLRELGRALALVGREPAHLDHYRIIVHCYSRLGQAAEALSWVRRARATAAGAVDAGFERQEAEMNAALLEMQVRTAESILLASPGDPEVVARLDAARRELTSFRFFEARRNAERSPADLPARHALALLCLERGLLDEAIAHFQQSQNNPKLRPDALAGLGRAYKGKRQFDLAVAHFLVAKSEPGPMDDRKKSAVYQLAECYEMMGRPEQAMAEYKAIYAEDIGYRDVAARINAHYSKT